MSAPGGNVLACELAIEATALWALGQHDASAQTLQRLDVPNDPKVQINEWLATYYADSGVSLDKLSTQLADWLEANKPEDAVNRTAFTAAAINYAMLLFVQQQHAKALAVLEPLYNSVEAMHGGAALCLCVLLLEIYLGSNQLPKAAQVLHYLQASTSPNTPVRAAFSPDVADEAGSNHAGDAEQGQQQASSSLRHEHLQQQSPRHAPQQQQAHLSPKRPLHLPSPKQSPGQPGMQQEGQLQNKQQQEEQQEQPTGPLTLDLPLVIRSTSAFMQQVVEVVEQQGGQLPCMDVPALLHLYKARLAMACSNQKAAKKEVKALLALQPSSATAVLLKSQLEVLRQQPRKALKSLAPVLAAVSQCSSRNKLQLLNVLAAIHQQLGKHHVAALYLSTASAQHHAAFCRQLGQQCSLDSNSRAGGAKQRHQQKGGKSTAAKAGAAASSKQEAAAAGADDVQGPRGSRQLLPDDSDALHYNMGLQQLALCNWQAALACFDSASCRFYMQPQLWLRMAEASISLYHEQQEQMQEQQQLHGEQHRKQQQLVMIQAGQQPLVGQQNSSRASRSGGSSSAGKGGAAAGAGTELLQQAAEQLATGLAVLRQQQAEAAKQAEEAAAAVTAAVAVAAAGDQQLSLATVAGASGWLGAASQASLFSQGSEESSTAGGVGDAADFATCSSAAAAAAAAAAEGDAAAAAAAGISPWDACVLSPGTPAVQQALLANQAYVHLLLQQPQQALEAAKALLACSSMSPQQHYLGSCYAAEAFCILGRMGEAAEQLQGHVALYMSGSGGSSGPGSSAAADACSSSAAGERYGTSIIITADALGGPKAGSIVSDDEATCVGSKGGGVCGLGPNQAEAGGSAQQRERHVAVLCNMASVLATQGDGQESRRYAALAAGLDPGSVPAHVLLEASFATASAPETMGGSRW